MVSPRSFRRVGGAHRSVEDADAKMLRSHRPKRRTVQHARVLLVGELGARQSHRGLQHRSISGQRVTVSMARAIDAVAQTDR